jgi:protein-tyrosine-phosphatase
VKEPLHLVFVCIGNRNRSPFAEFFFSKLISEKDKGFVNEIRVTSAGFVSQRTKEKMASMQIGAPEPFFGRPLARTTRVALAGQSISVPEEWRTRELTSDIVKKADLLITALPWQKRELMRLYPKAVAMIFTLREISQWDGYLLLEDYEFKGIPRDGTLWDYVEENPDYVSKILSEAEKMLIKAYPNILNQLGLKAAE